MESGLMPRREEGFMAIAYCLRRVKNKELRQHIYANIGDVMVSDVDLFMFVKYATLLNVPEEEAPAPPVQQPVDSSELPQRRARLSLANPVPIEPQLPIGSNPEPVAAPANPIHGFGRGMKRAIGQWYTNKTPKELSDIMGRRRGLYRWTHRDLFKLCHIKFDDSQKDKVQIMKAMFNRGVKVLREMDTNAAEDQATGSMVRMCQIFRFKMCEDPTEGAKMFVRNGFDMDQVPSHFLAEPKFWVVALPHVPYADMLRILLTLHGYGQLGKNAALKKCFVERLGNKEQVRSSGVLPLQLLALINGYKSGHRYSESIKVSVFCFIFRSFYINYKLCYHSTVFFFVFVS